jgi:hypothetical protein
MEEQIHAPRIGELPNPKVLNRATAIAAAVAGLLVVTVILPAEYGIDPTGLGRLLNLTEMGKMKRMAAQNAAAAKPAKLPPLDYKSGQSGQETVFLAPGEGREVKAAMQTGGEMQYEWTTNNLPVHYELHGEPRGAAKGVYTSYKIGISKGEKGTFKAPFEGTQGWYWRNDTPFPVKVTVKASGSWAHFGVVASKPRPQGR